LIYKRISEGAEAEERGYIVSNPLIGEEEGVKKNHCPEAITAHLI